MDDPGRLVTDAEHARHRLDALADQLDDMVRRLRREIRLLDEQGGASERADDRRGGGDLDAGS
jgi:hypothetical protein